MDIILFQYINGFAFKWRWLDATAVFLAKYFEFILLFLLLVFLFGDYKNRKKMVFLALLAGIISRLVVAEIFYYFIPMARPFAIEPTNSSVNLLVLHPETPGFPSGHASFYFALSFVLYAYNKKLGLVFLISSFLICLARVFTGLHWVSDIIAGIILGIVVARLVIALPENNKNIIGLIKRQ